ncbi:glycosyltransferase [Trinickia sp. LjRoot230]|uniref:glycosyltransferase n=1 Tax=Trinickia sp. LjRoot230 TaxID=3342288 RepID=UPI003ED1071A
MKFTVVTYGTEGDTRPLAALCRALMDAGHETQLLADAATLGAARTLGVPAAALAGDIRQALMPGEALADAIVRKGGFGATAEALARIANENTAAWMAQAADASAGCDAVIVSALASFVGLSVAESRRVPAIGASMIPISPTAAFASPFLRPTMVPRFLNRVSHRFVNAMLWRAFRTTTNAARATVCGLPKRSRVWTEHPILYGISPTLLPRPDDWPDHAQICGQWVGPAAAWTPPASLDAFLAAGEPPIYVGFGSMAGFDTPRFLDALVAAVGSRRALFYPGWSGIGHGALPSNFHVIGDTPHAWLFPRVSVVIHHGGAGTTHSAVRAGVPSVVVPFAADQFFWAHRLTALGVAGPPIDANKCAPAAFADGIAFALRPAARQRAAALAARMATENGTARAVTTIEAIVRARGK